MPKNVIIVGAVALGPKVACRLRRLDPDINITVIDRDSLISYGGCGIPYYVGGDITDIEELFSTTSHAIRDSEFFRSVKGITIHPRTEAVSLNRREKTLTVRHLDAKEGQPAEEDLPYDKLVIASGATPVRPPIPGADLPRVYTVSNLHSAREIKETIQQGQVSRAVVIGAGAIGIEMAEALTDLWGVETTLVEMADQVLPAALGKNAAQMVHTQLERNEVKTLVSQKVTQIQGTPETGVTGVVIGDTVLDCDLVVMSAGVRPNTGFAADAGLATGLSGALIVDRNLRTTDPDIYAGGDCIEMRNLVSGANMTMPLGSLANRQGRIIANNIHGRASQFKGTVGTFCIKVFDMGAATAGLTVAQAKEAGFDPVHALVSQFDRAHFYPDAKFMYIQLIADRSTRKILGIEAVGYQSDAVKARVDAVAPLLAAGLDVDQVCTLETGYAPPFASAMDIINNAGNVLDNILEGRNTPVDMMDFVRLFHEQEITVVDLREASEAEPFQKQYGERWRNIPQADLRQRFDELPRDEDLYLICGTGARSYEAQVVLNQKGFDRIKNVQGGYALLAMTDPGFIPED